MMPKIVRNVVVLGVLCLSITWATAVFSRSDGKFQPSSTIINVENVSQIQQLTTLPYDAVDMAFSVDGAWLAIGLEDGVIVVIDMASGEAVHYLRHWLRVERRDQLVSVVFANRSNMLATAASNFPFPLGDGSLRIWDVNTGRQIGQTIEVECLSPISFSFDDRYMVCEPHTTVIDVEGGFVQTPRADGNGLGATQFSAATPLLATSSVSGIHIWSMAEETELTTLRNRRMSHLDFSPDGNWLAAWTGDNVVYLWNMERFRRHRIDLNLNVRFTAVAFSPDSGMMATGDSYGRTSLRLWDVQTGEMLMRLNGHDDSIRSLFFHPDGTLIASASRDSSVRIWDIEQGVTLKTIEVRGDVDEAIFSPRGNVLVIMHENGVEIWGIPE